jgi:hypothetical protein
VHPEIAWDPIPGADGYEVSLSSSVGQSIMGPLTITTSSFIFVTRLEPYSHYSVSIRPFNAYGFASCLIFDFKQKYDQKKISL